MTKPLKYRPATRKDINHFYPHLKYTFKAVVAENEDKVLGIGGIYYDGDSIVVFSRFDPELKTYPLALARGAKKIMKIVGEKTCYAVADENIPESQNLLERLGFKHIEGRVYKWTH